MPIPLYCRAFPAFACFGLYTTATVIVPFAARRGTPPNIPATLLPAVLYYSSALRTCFTFLLAYLCLRVTSRLRVTYTATCLSQLRWILPHAAQHRLHGFTCCSVACDHAAHTRYTYLLLCRVRCCRAPSCGSAACHCAPACRRSTIPFAGSVHAAHGTFILFCRNILLRTTFAFGSGSVRTGSLLPAFA